MSLAFMQFLLLPSPQNSISLVCSSNVPWCRPVHMPRLQLSCRGLEYHQQRYHNDPGGVPEEDSEVQHWDLEGSHRRPMPGGSRSEAGMPGQLQYSQALLPVVQGRPTNRRYWTWNLILKEGHFLKCLKICLNCLISLKNLPAVLHWYICINLYFTCLYACVFIYFVFAAAICFILTKQGLMEDHQIGDMCHPL